MTIKFKNVFVNNTATVAGPFVTDGPFKYDYEIKDFYDGEETFEKSEIKQLKRSIGILLNKEKKKEEDIDLLISSDLLNQITVSNYAASKINIPFLGVYNACASMCEEILLASNLIDSGKIKNAICTTSSSNVTSERQYRNPVEYGAPKKMYQTFTVTGATAILLSSISSKIKVESATIGRVIDKGIKDVADMGSIMAPSAADTLDTHLKDTKRSPEYYDLILTGDLGIYGKEIFKDYVKKVFGLNLENYNDSATMIYNMKDKNVYAGGSGISCLPLVVYSYVIPQMLEGKLKKVLLLATGALMSPTMINQKLSIPSIAHAISLEVI